MDSALIMFNSFFVILDILYLNIKLFNYSLTKTKKRIRSDYLLRVTILNLHEITKTGFKNLTPGSTHSRKNGKLTKNSNNRNNKNVLQH